MVLIAISAKWLKDDIYIQKLLKKYQSIISVKYLDYDLDEEVKYYNVLKYLPVIILLDENGKEIKRYTKDIKEDELDKLLERRV